MDNVLFRLPLYTFCSGFVLKVIQNIYIKILVDTTSHWSRQIETLTFSIDIIASLFFIFLIGFYLQKQYSAKDFFLSCSLLVIYSIFVLLFEKILLPKLEALQEFDAAIYFLQLPTYLFSFLNLIIFYLTQGEIPEFYKIIYLFSPYLFLLFAKKNKTTCKQA